MIILKIINFFVYVWYIGNCIFKSDEFVYVIWWIKNKKSNLSLKKFIILLGKVLEELVIYFDEMSNLNKFEFLEFCVIYKLLKWKKFFFFFIFWR